MYAITVAESRRFTVLSREFRGTPTGIDIRKVALLGTTPVTNLSIAHKDPGVGQIGAGYVRALLACFESALEALVANVDGGRARGAA